MKKHILLGTALSSLLMLGACDYNEDNFPGYDDLATITNVQSDTLDLVAADYKKIADLKANQDLALSKDPEGETYLTALKQLAKDGFFTETITPSEFLPAYLENTYPYVTDNSKILINYRMAGNLPEYLTAIAAAKEFDLGSGEYKTVWGENRVVKFLTPSTLKQIPALLKDKVKSPKEGDVYQVNYAWSETEPSTGGDGGEVVEPINKISDALAASGDYKVQGTVITTYAQGFLLSDDSGQILVYLKAKPNCTVGDIVTVEGTTSKYANLMQFTNTPTPVVTRTGRAESFSYPTPVEYTGAQLDAYVAKVDGIHYVKITGKLVVSNYLNLEVSGAAQEGSVQYPFDGVVDKSLNGQQVTVVGYLIGASSRYNIMVTSVEPVGGSVYSPIGEVAMAKEAGDYTVKGQVVAKYQRGFMLSDGSGIIQVYDSNGFDVVPGDIVKVSGKVTNRSGLNQFGTTPTCEKLASGTVTHPAVALNLDAAAMEEYVAAPFFTYVKYTGELSISGTYYNVIIPDTDKFQGSIQFPTDGMVDVSLNGKQVTVEGYTVGVSSNKYVNTMAVKVTEATAEAAGNTRAVTRASDVTPNTSALYQYNGSSWTVYEKNENVDIVVMQPSDYASVGSSSLSKPDEVLPVYLNNSFPYAQAGNITTVVYRYDKSVAADEYTYDGAAWVKTVASVPGTIVFMKAGGKWIEAVEYYFNDFDGLLHGGAHIVDIDIPESLKDKKVWRATDGYNTILGSSHDGSKACKAESWLITGEIDLSKAVTPKMMVTAKCKYLPSGKTMTDFVNVYISAVYQEGDEIVKEDKNIKDWVKLDFPEWPVNDSFVDMETMVPAEFIGKKVYVGFQYVGSEGGVPNIQMKNFVVKE